MSAGMDARADGKFLLTLLTPSLQVGGARPRPLIYETAVYTPREGRERLRLESAGRLEAGKLEQIFFGEELARQGIHEYLEILKRDPFNPILARVAVVKGTAQDLLNKSIKWQHLPLPGMYFRGLLEQAAAGGSVPMTTVDRFYVEYFAPGIDPILPAIEATPKRARLLGSALFRDDRLVGELNVDETFLLLALKGQAKSHGLILPSPKGLPGRKRKTRMAIRFTSARVRRRLSLRSSNPAIAFELRLLGSLEEFQMVYPTTDRGRRELEEFAGRFIEGQLSGLWRKLRAAGTDPLGVGNMVRAYQYDYWRRHDWRRVYPKVEARFRVTVDLLNYGLIR